MPNVNLNKIKFEYKLFEKIESQKFLNHETNLGVAVSGGPDSMLLLYFINKWIKKKNKLLTVFTFNHNLRSQSFEEAKLVEITCRTLGCKFIKIDWHEHPKTAIMEKARIARYTEIAKHCKKLNIKTLFLGHHADDIAETVSMRILKKSNLEGLCPIHEVRELFGIRLFRPLLELQKKEILEVNKIFNIKFLDDPSNRNNNFLRPRIRNILKKNNELKINLIKASMLFCKIKHFNNNFIKRNFNKFIEFKNEGYLIIDLALFRNYPKHLVLIFLKSILKKIGNKVYPPRNKRLLHIYDKIFNNKHFTYSQSGCILNLKNNSLFIYREFNFVKKNSLVEGQKSIDWDNRFRIINKSKHPLKVYPLGAVINNNFYKNNYRINKKYIKSIPFTIRITLPAIKTLEGLIHIPHLNISELNRADKSIDIQTLAFFDKT